MTASTHKKRRPPHGGIPHPQAKPLSERDARIAALVLERRPYKDIGLAFGISGERVRQIVGALGLTALGGRERLRERRQSALDLLAGGATDQEAADRVGLTRKTVSGIRLAAGIERERRVDPTIARGLRLVAEGASIGATEAQLGIPRNALFRAADRAGLRSRYAKDRDLSHRLTKVPEWRAEGVGWDEIARRCAEIEGRPVKGAGLRTWVALRAKRQQ